MKPLPALFALLLLATATGKDAPPVTATEKPLELEPVQVRGNAISSFAIDIVIHSDRETKRVNRIFITHVRPDTDAERTGLQVGDEIVKLDGVPVKGMDSRVAEGSPLGRIFLAREPGDDLKLEVLTRRTQNFTLRAQRGSPMDGLR
jgi:C-terminal processing protease CtpA/Prc